MSDVVGYTIESKAGSSRPIRWRLPALVLAVTACAIVYFFTRPCRQLAGHYEGRIGGPFSDYKAQFGMNLRQEGSALSGSCDVSHHQSTNRVILQHFELTGFARANSFRVSGKLDKVTLIFEGETSQGTQILGRTWRESSGIATDSTAFSCDLINARVSPQTLSVRKKKARD